MIFALPFWEQLRIEQGQAAGSNSFFPAALPRWSLHVCHASCHPHSQNQFEVVPRGFKDIACMQNAL